MDASLADERSACSDPGYDWYRHSPLELRRIASQCNTRLYSELNYHRAYYLDLLRESEAVSGVISWSDNGSAASATAHKLYMQLVEQLAPLYYTSDEELAAWLVSEYEIRNEIAELWLRGYGVLAERLGRLHPEL
jgi:hypothetical protein